MFNDSCLMTLSSVKAWPPMKAATLIAIALIMVSCSAVHTSQVSFAQAERLKWQEQADTGDAEAQFQMGNTWCCSDTKGFFYTLEAVNWWCKAARQNHQGARRQLAKHSINHEKCTINRNSNDKS